MPTSRLLVFSLVLALLGCGRPNDAVPQAQPEPAPAMPAPPPEVTEKAPPKAPASIPTLPPLDWTQDVKEMRFPTAPASGKLNGRPFAPQAAELSRIGGRFLTLRQGDEFNPDLQVKVLLSPAKDEAFSGKTYEVAAEAGPASLPVSVTWKGRESQAADIKTFEEKLALRLEFGREDGGKLPGKIYLCLPDAERSYVAGAFTADVEPDYARPPRPDEVPCVAGKITLKGRDEIALVAGFIGLAADGTTVSNIAGTTIAPKAETSVSSAPSPPQRSTLVNDAEAGCLYRHARLAPGRYLVFAGTGDRYVDWRWVEVGDKARLTIDFTVEPDAAGALVVVLPKGAKEGVRLIPLDEAGRVPDVKEALGALSIALKTDVPAKDGQVVLDGLRPGPYRVSVGPAAKDVTVKAKETAKADLSAP